MTEAQRAVARHCKNIAATWFSTLTLTQVQQPAPGRACWLFTDPSGARFGIYLEGNEEFFRAGLAIILAEDLIRYGWSVREEAGVRWLLNPDYTERRDGGERAPEALGSPPPA